MKVLFFTPHAALWAHTAPEALLARSLAEHGHEISYLTCGAAQSYCAVMASRRVSPPVAPSVAAPFCAQCRSTGARIGRMYGFPVAELASFLSPAERDICSALAEEAAKAQSLDTVHLDIRVGRLALYEFTLAHKKMSTDLTTEQWVEYRVYLENALISLTAFANYLRTQRVDAVIAFSPQYSNINPCMQYAAKLGVRTLFIENGTNIADRLGTMRIWDWPVHGLVNPALQYWGETEQNRITADRAATVTGHFRQLLNGKHFAVFSPAHTGDGLLREKWMIKPHQRVITMTLSSYDEAYAALLVDGFPEKKVFSDVFRTQVEWLRATIAWARARPDIFLVIRVHPRDFPNKRERVHSEQSLVLGTVLDDVPDNVFVNWPSQNVSLYDVLDITDVLTTGWSVTAIEALTLGIPVVTYDRHLPSYPADIHRTGRSEAEYFVNIDDALAEGWSFRNARNGFRWMAYNFVDCVVPVSAALSRREIYLRWTLPWIWTRACSRLPFLGQRLDLLRWRDAREGGRLLNDLLVEGHDALPPARPQGPPVAHEEEDAILKGELAKLHRLLYPQAAQQPRRGLDAKIHDFLVGASL